MSSASSEPAVATEVAIAAGRQRAAVTVAGGGLRSWCVDGEELLDTYPEGAAADSFRGSVLAPWPNRLRDGRYRFAGEEHRLEVNEPERGAALHGLVLGASWDVVERSAGTVALEHGLAPRAGYPFTLRIEARYAVGDDGLEVTLRATNVGERPAPYGAGLHPYLRAGGARVDDDRLEVPARTRVPVDGRMLPTGPPVEVAAGGEHDFGRLRRIGARALDTTFGDLVRGGDGRASVRLVAGGAREREVTVWLDEGFRFVHVYTADAVDDPNRRRAGIAIEPMTCAPDALNSGVGLEVLEPGASTTARCGFAARWP